MLKLMSLMALFAATLIAPKQTQEQQENHTEGKEYKIQVALLLDVSGSMDGLIEQAKSQLWKMVNELATSKKGGKSPNIELALYEYGKDTHPKAGGYIKQLVPLTTDLDLVSDKLFGLTTNGGSEFCGWAIKDAVNGLKWSKSNDDLKIIIIAGNEEFTQGTVDYKKSCKTSITNGIVVNTIFCGDCDEGVRTMWKDGADRADGKYMCINHNDKVVHVETPFDDDIVDLNTKLNKTYIAYGKKGKDKVARQKAQDVNAGGYGKANLAERALSKSKKNVYKNDEWDVVDAVEEKGEAALDDMDEDELPEEMKKMNKEERKEYVGKKAKEREAIQKEIQELSTKRNKYIADERKKMSTGSKNTLDEVMLKAVREQAEAKKFKFEE
ncbi:MAG: VWA domain-containing protein [Aureispira sp.]|nr:VWA domain-containing protein [Aureispira sp.]